jgi:hypothetical protein
MEKILRSWACLGINEWIYAFFPWWLVGLAFQAIYPLKWLGVALGIGVFSMISTYLLGEVCKGWSKKVWGLQRYFVFPIYRWMAVLLIRGRMNLPRNKRYFLLHVRSRPGEIFNEMRKDVQKGLVSSWTRDSVFLGNTFGSLGKLQLKQLTHGGKIESIPGTFFPGQTWLLNTKYYQRKMFGRVFSQNSDWKMIKFTPDGKGGITLN